MIKKPSRPEITGKKQRIYDNLYSRAAVRRVSKLNLNNNKKPKLREILKNMAKNYTI
jgi:hypothetical protein